MSNRVETIFRIKVPKRDKILKRKRIKQICITNTAKMFIQLFPEVKFKVSNTTLKRGH
jgi:hypothetical protein